MPGLAELVRRLVEHRVPSARTPPDDSRLRHVAAFGPNPGNLRMFDYAPDRRRGRQPGLIVVLHGCTQTAAGYDEASGWSRLADQDGFVLLFPEQRNENNPKGCFNWFLPEHTSRGRGEAASIRQMIEHATREHGVDPARVYVTGLSAGGAMAAAMLATYPEVFAAGAVIAGLPFGAATDVQGAFKAMFNGTVRTPERWGDLVRKAAPPPPRWPRVDIWHGTADATVKPVNSAELVKQWANVHALDGVAAETDVLDGATRRLFRDGSGTVRITETLVPDLGHGTPLDTAPGAPGRGKAAPFMLEAGISSTYHIARSFELASERPNSAAAPSAARAGARPQGHPPHGQPHLTSIQEVITTALRRAGLLKT